MKASSGSAPAGDEYSRFLLDRIKQLEEVNYGLKGQLAQIEEGGRDYEAMRMQYEREVRKLRSELEKLRASPLIIGTVVEVIDNKRVLVKSSTGPKFVVNYSQFIDTKEVVPGAQVGMNQQSLAVVSVLPSAKDPAVYGMEVIESPDVGYEIIGGLNKQIEEIREVVELPLTKPKMFERIGVEPPKGVLLVGAPGTGSELVQKYIGEGARMVRELFELAEEKAPSIVFIDEIDAIAARRLEDGTTGEREVQRTMMQLLAEIDGFDQRGDVRIIGATNRPDILDSALLRPGRFDRIIEIPKPDREGRKEIFQIHTAKMKLKKDVDIDILAGLTENATGADITAISIEAGMLAVKWDKKAIAMEDFEQAIKKIMGDAHRVYTGPKVPGEMFA
jgi:proteasome regulatory subunit